MGTQLELLGDFVEQADANESVEDLAPLESSTVSQAVVSGNDWTTETILSQINKGNIMLNPKFQRRDAWEADRKSRFIESLILGLPVPQLVLAESKSQKGSYIVIDGKQRLLSIRQFASKPGDDKFISLRLTGLSMRKDLVHKTLGDLQAPEFFADLSAFENQPIRTVVIKNWPNENFLYHVFLRLNTGSVPLSPQELRQALHPGEFTDFADTRSGTSKALQIILNIKKPDFRMRDAELLIRYYAYNNFLPEYTGDLKAFLDLTCHTFNQQWKYQKDSIEQQAVEFEEACNAAVAIFGPRNAFRKWLGSVFETKFNRAIFDFMAVSLANPEVRLRALAEKEKVADAFKKLCMGDAKFLASIERTTKSLDATCYRINAWNKALNESLGTRLPTPKIEETAGSRKIILS